MSDRTTTRSHDRILRVTSLKGVLAFFSLTFLLACEFQSPRNLEIQRLVHNLNESIVSDCADKSRELIADEILFVSENGKFILKKDEFLNKLAGPNIRVKAIDVSGFSFYAAGEDIEVAFYQDETIYLVSLAKESVYRSRIKYSFRQESGRWVLYQVNRQTIDAVFPNSVRVIKNWISRVI